MQIIYVVDRRKTTIWDGPNAIKKITRHWDYGGLVANVTLEFKIDRYQIVYAWECDGSCSYREWTYSRTKKDYATIYQELNKRKEELVQAG